MSIDEQRVREFAYQIWESEGKPAGQEDRHWEMARKLAEAEAVGQQLPTTPKPRRISKPKAVTLAEAEAQVEQAATKPALLKKPRTPRSKA
ncbi:DUF2934 domain-containing protein [Pseudomonas sp. PDM16]|uniref:DUF2934 domain-containing protein n=1 Tax=Pseudomonas sp. PDM16 TaxID=2769292 RepID=UPI001782E09B|nr:DUF2934 domain-containing protein [Pseudomonas sp. PDM16]MBD9416169.1 DUF2934 domain-containing protein [Pseudomonas sp. PDM16]